MKQLKMLIRHLLLNVLEKCSGMAGFYFLYAGWYTRIYYFSTLVACFRSQIYQPVSTFYHIRIMLDDQYRVSLLN